MLHNKGKRTVTLSVRMSCSGLRGPKELGIIQPTSRPELPQIDSIGALLQGYDLRLVYELDPAEQACAGQLERGARARAERPKISDPAPGAGSEVAITASRIRSSDRCCAWRSAAAPRGW